MRVGYACICLGKEEARCQRTTVLRNVTEERLRLLIRANLDGLEEILAYNESHGYRLFRLGNAFIPFASHPANTLPWWEEFGDRFRQIGRWVRSRGHRLSFHASHYTILNSAQPHVVDAALADVSYMARVLEVMELDAEHKIILHVGAKTPTPEEAVARLEAALERVAPEHRRHLVLENDDRCFTLQEVLAVSRRVDLPVVIDVFHHQVLPGDWSGVPCVELLDRTFATWRPGSGVPKIHFSTQDPDKRPGAHAHGIDIEEFRRFLRDSRGASRDFDIMFESKGKDLSLQPIMPLLAADPRFAPLLRAA